MCEASTSYDGDVQDAKGDDQGTLKARAIRERERGCCEWWILLS